jgi:hypothetical protein
VSFSPFYVIKPKLSDIIKGESYLDEYQSKEGQFHKEDIYQIRIGHKNEIEYWQVTAKEVLKFRPSTETFITRK